jgi:hypothetical protein
MSKEDLAYLRHVALGRLERLFASHPDGSGRYRGRMLCLLLCQGSALHFCDGTSGIKDFDVWAFFDELAAIAFPWRWRGTADFGTSKFGRHPKDAGYAGRRVDVLGRSLKRLCGETGVAAATRYFREGRTRSARLLARRPVIDLSADRCGQAIWYPVRDRNRSG